MNNFPCICGHSELDHCHKRPIPCTCNGKYCDICMMSGTELFHNFKGDNLRYLEIKSEESCKKR